jgi:hypothetical protein
MKGDILDDAVALVEDAEHSRALGHRRHAALAVRSRRDATRAWQWRILFRLPLAARGERKGGEQGCSGWLHAYSGIQGS